MLYMAVIHGWNPVTAFSSNKETAKRLALEKKKELYRDDLDVWSWQRVEEYYGASVEEVTEGTVLY